MTARPAVLAAMAICLGIVAGLHWPANPAFVTTAMAVVCAASVITGRMLERRAITARGRSVRLLAALIVFVGIGHQRVATRIRQHEDYRRYTASAAVISGVIKGPVDETNETLRFRFAAPGDGAIRVTLTGLASSSAAACIEDGASITLQGPHEIGVQKRNPADFDYGRFLFSKGYSGAATLADRDAVRCTGPPRALRKGLGNLRTRLLATISRRATLRAKPLLRALLIGDRSGIDESTRGWLSRAGLMHLLAVSGLHVLLAGFAVYRFLFSALIRTPLSWYSIECIRVPATIILLVLFALITGAAPSVVRAVTMGALLMSRTLVKRTSDTLNALGAAATGILLFRPEQLLDVGFQLSFSAVSGIVLMAPRLARAFSVSGRRPGFLATSVSVSVAATIATAPVVSGSFGFVPLAGVVLNVLAVPAASVALASGFLMLATEPLLPTVAGLFGTTASLAISSVTFLAETSDRVLPQLTIVTSAGGMARILSAVASTLLVLHASRNRFRWTGTVMCLLVVVASIWLPVARRSHATTLDVVFVDVGQGDAVVVRTPDQRFLVVDTGPPGRAASAAARSLVPLLQSMGARRVDLLVVTHPHADHNGGVDDLRSSFPVSVFVADSAFAGDRINIGSSVTLDVLAPFRQQLGPQTRSLSTPNNQSIVLKLNYRDVCILLTGDAESEAEELIVGAGYSLECDVVKVGHHGSSSSSSWPFVKALSADRTGDRHAIVTVGGRNRFGHPDDEIVDRWTSFGWRVSRTDHGAQWITTDGKTVSLKQWR